MSNASPFHQSEIDIQRRLGLDEKVARTTKGFIRPYMPEQHQDFFSQLTFVVVTLIDDNGSPWVVPLFGSSGFIQAADSRTLEIHATSALFEHLDATPSIGAKIGLLGIQLETRRRNRVNGVIQNVTDQCIVLTVEQSFGNCPQYIQQRQAQNTKNQTNPIEVELAWESSLSQESMQLIQSADTFFIGSRSKIIDDDPRNGLDASHRGGLPGFIKVEKSALLFPDFSGNRFFNTLGNIESDGRVGLWVSNFESGHAVLISGEAKILWNDKRVEQLEGAERIVQVNVERSCYVKQMLPVEWELVAISPSLKRTGIWEK